MFFIIDIINEIIKAGESCCLHGNFSLFLLFFFCFSHIIPLSAKNKSIITTDKISAKGTNIIYEIHKAKSFINKIVIFNFDIVNSFLTQSIKKLDNH